jgi:integrase/recombinase XerC
MPRTVREEFRTFLAGRTTGPVFQGRKGGRLCHRHAHRRLAGWLKKAGISRPASPHTLRHAFASSLYARTGDLLLVQKALRHRNIASTMVYAHLDEGRLRKALEA